MNVQHFDLDSRPLVFQPDEQLAPPAGVHVPIAAFVRPNALDAQVHLKILGNL